MVHAVACSWVEHPRRCPGGRSVAHVREQLVARIQDLAQFDERYTREIEPRYAEIHTPTLVLWGEQDGWLAPEFDRQLAEAIPDAHLKLIRHGGHFLPEDQPGPVADDLAAFASQ